MALTKISGEVIQSGINIGIVTASTINVGSAVTIHTGGFQVGTSNLHSTGLNLGSGNIISHNINSTGIITATSFSGNLSGNAATVTTNANLTGDVTSTGNATAIAAGVIVNADINASAGIVDTKLATIATAGKVSNSATTATNANTASAIVARDASGNFSAGTITATLSGNATGLSGTPNITVGSINASGIITATTFSGSGANLTGITSTSLVNNSINKEQIRDSEITNSKLANESITASKFIGNSTTIDLSRKRIYLPQGFYVYGTDASVPSGTDLNGFPYGEGYNWDGYTTVSGYAASGSTVTARNFNNSPNGLLIIEMTRTPSSGGGPYGNITGGGHEIWSVNTAHHGWSGGGATLINATGTLHGSYTTGGWYGIYITGGASGTYYRVTFIH